MEEVIPDDLIAFPESKSVRTSGHLFLESRLLKLDSFAECLSSCS